MGMDMTFMASLNAFKSRCGWVSEIPWIPHPIFLRLFQHTELEHTPKRNLYQWAVIRDSFHLLGVAGGWGVARNFPLGIRSAHRNETNGEPWNLKEPIRDHRFGGEGHLVVFINPPG